MGVHALGVIAAPALGLLAWQGTRRRLQQAPAPPAELSSTGCSLLWDCLIPSLCLSSSGRCLSVGRWWDGNCTVSEDEQQRIPGAVVGLPGCWSPVSSWELGRIRPGVAVLEGQRGNEAQTRADAAGEVG